MRKILAAIDDMFFASKVNGVAQQVGVSLTYAKTPADILARARTEQPALIIFDLNSLRAQPIETIKALKAEADLQQIPLLGFLSHVQVDLQQQAVAAGCERVIPRSAFARDLSQILSGEL